MGFGDDWEAKQLALPYLAMKAGIAYRIMTGHRVAATCLLIGHQFQVHRVGVYGGAIGGHLMGLLLAIMWPATRSPVTGRWLITGPS